MRLVNRNNCEQRASKQASKAQANPDLLYARRVGRYAEDFLRIPAWRVALGAWRKGHPTNDTLNREW